MTFHAEIAVEDIRRHEQRVYFVTFALVQVVQLLNTVTALFPTNDLRLVAEFVIQEKVFEFGILLGIEVVD